MIAGGGDVYAKPDPSDIFIMLDRANESPAGRYAPIVIPSGKPDRILENVDSIPPVCPLHTDDLVLDFCVLGHCRRRSWMSR